MYGSCLEGECLCCGVEVPECGVCALPVKLDVIPGGEPPPLSRLPLATKFICS